MPKATIASDTQRFDLESCPEGFVALKRLTYGQFLQRRDMATELQIAAEDGDAKAKTTIQTMQQVVAMFEFKNTVVEHNLTGDDDQPLDFTRPSILDVLDPRIGQEISNLIDKMNQFEEVAKN